MAQRQLRRPGRLPGVPYVGIQRYFLTLCTAERRKWFADAALVDQVRSQLSQSAVDHRFAIPAHCLMPDHVHLFAEGTALESDLRRFVSSFKQKSGFRFSKERAARLWQDGYHDRILREEEGTLAVVRYILENPVRAGLVANFSDYPYSGSDRYSLDELATASSQG
jgi:REP element-mobilizing transposase RayT